MAENQNQPNEASPKAIAQSSPSHFPEDSHAPQLQPANIKTVQMEVQKHPHHVMHSKKWNEYLLEFFMLFLAVFLGFIAENIRENSVEKHKEKEYMESLLADLRNDTAEFQTKLKRFSLFPAALNQLARDCFAAVLTDTIQQRMYYANMRYLGTTQIYFTEKTAAQLKNSGSMRLISHPEVSDSITLYWQGIEDVKFTDANHENYRRAVRQLSFKIFNYTFYKPYDNTKGTEVMFTVDHPQLTVKDPLLLKEYGSEVSLIASNMQTYYLPAIEKQRQMAVKLIALIQKVYHLKVNEEVNKN